MAQRSDGDRLTASGQVGRFQVVRSNEEVIIIIDTTTGDLYKATPGDIKPFNQRPKPDPRLGGRPMDGFGEKKGGPMGMGGFDEKMKMKGGGGFKEEVERKSKDARRPIKDDFFPKDKAKSFDKEKGDFKDKAKDGFKKDKD